MYYGNLVRETDVLPTEEINNNVKDWFAVDKKLRDPVVEGLFYEGDIVSVSGYYGDCKSPVIQQLAYCLVSGAQYLGRRVPSPRPVALVDLENAKTDVYTSLNNIRRRLVNEPVRELRTFIRRGTDNNPDTIRISQVVWDSIRSKIRNRDLQIEMLSDILSNEPDSVIIIDPVQSFFHLNKVDEREVSVTVSELRNLLNQYPRASIVTVWNLRKRDKKVKRSNPLTNVRDHLDEVSGSGDIINRTDVRLVVGPHPAKPDLYVMNGVARGRKFSPILFRKVSIDPEGAMDFSSLAGFEAVDIVRSTLSPERYAQFVRLPVIFTVKYVGNKAVITSPIKKPFELPKTTAWRLVTKLLEEGLLTEVEPGTYTKAGK